MNLVKLVKNLPGHFCNVVESGKDEFKSCDSVSGSLKSAGEHFFQEMLHLYCLCLC